MKLAVIPARGGSKRIPRKNIRHFLGKPIIAYSIETALESGLFDEVMVSTDDEEIADVARKYGASIPFMRPEDIADDHAVILDVLKSVLAWFEDNRNPPDYVCCIYATAPFIRAADLREAFGRVNGSVHGGAMSVAKFTFPIQRALKVAETDCLKMIDENHLTTRSQDLPEAYMDAAQFLLLRKDALKQCRQSPLEQDLAPVVIPTGRVQDIDTLEDWDRAELLYQVMHNLDSGH